jgi:hypothetical protein
MVVYKIPYEKARPRQHYNSKGHSKRAYDTEEEADKYIMKHRLKGMKSYYCRTCNKYHIGHYNILE